MRLPHHIIMEDEIMKKRSMIVAALCSMCLALSNPIPALADASKVVTLGADLTDEQKNTSRQMQARYRSSQLITRMSAIIWENIFQARRSVQEL